MLSLPWFLVDVCMLCRSWSINFSTNITNGRLYCVQWSDLPWLCHGQCATVRGGDLSQHGGAEQPVTECNSSHSLRAKYLWRQCQVGCRCLISWCCFLLVFGWCNLMCDGFQFWHTVHMYVYVCVPDYTPCKYSNDPCVCVCVCVYSFSQCGVNYS